MLWIGITGSMGSGKSSAAEVLRQMGYAVIDADEVVRDLMKPGQTAEKQILQTFGETVKGPDGRLDRRLLGQIVFKDPAKLSQLESILHPLVREQVATEKQKLRNAGTPVAFYDVPLLFEKNMQDQFDYIIVVSASRELCIQRVQQRTGLSRPEIEARLKAQMDPAYKVARASAVVYNDSDLQDLRHEITGASRQFYTNGSHPLNLELTWIVYATRTLDSRQRNLRVHRRLRRAATSAAHRVS